MRVAVGRTLGWQFIKSTAFELRRTAGEYRFTGHGSGHGVGLCVIGLGLARHASAFILKGTSHASIMLGVAGLVVLVLGAGVTAFSGGE